MMRLLINRPLNGANVSQNSTVHGQLTGFPCIACLARWLTILLFSRSYTHNATQFLTYARLSTRCEAPKAGYWVLQDRS